MNDDPWWLSLWLLQEDPPDNEMQCICSYTLLNDDHVFVKVTASSRSTKYKWLVGGTKEKALMIYRPFRSGNREAAGGFGGAGTGLRLAHGLLGTRKS